MNATQNSSTMKLVRIALASAVGSLLWAGCAQPRVAVVNPEAIAYAPVDLTRQRPDTHPELRSGIWQTTTRNNTANTVATTNLRAPLAPEGTVDSTSLLAYNPEVINAVPPAEQDSIIIEAAGAERPAERRTLRERWFRRNRAPVQPEAEERRIIIEREETIEVQPIPAPYKPSVDEVEDDEGGKLMDTFFARKK